MAKETARHVRLGIFVMAGIVLLILGLYLIGNNKNLWGETFRVYVVFRNASGLQNGNNVRFSGINAGTVTNIEMINDSSIRVEMILDMSIKPYLRKNAVARIGTDGLMGNKLVNIEPSSVLSEVIEDGDTLTAGGSTDTAQILKKLDETAGNVNSISSDIKTITENIRRSKGSLYSVLLDTTIASRLNVSIDNISEMTENFRNFSTALADMMAETKSGKGLLGSVTNDTSMLYRQLRNAVTLMEKSGKDLSEVTNGLNESVKKLNQGHGSAGVLLNDSVSAMELKNTISNLDSSVYNFNENMKALQESWLLRSYFRRQKKSN
ncbi:MAG: MCE family protein [Bacteroidia bacterium]|nr:MCE family protein [Bacteroidia bacterium]